VKDKVSKSKLHVFRSLVSLAHADDELNTNEFTYLRELFERYELSIEQHLILKSDFQNPTDLKKNFEQITDSDDHKQFFFLARILCMMDGDFSAKEVQTLEKLQSLYLQGIGYDQKLEETQTCYDLYKNNSENKRSNKYVSADQIWSACTKKKAA